MGLGATGTHCPTASITRCLLGLSHVWGWVLGSLCTRPGPCPLGTPNPVGSTGDQQRCDMSYSNGLADKWEGCVSQEGQASLGRECGQRPEGDHAGLDREGSWRRSMSRSGCGQSRDSRKSTGGEGTEGNRGQGALLSLEIRVMLEPPSGLCGHPCPPG